MVSVTQITRSQIEKAYVGTASAGADTLALKKPNEIVLTFHTALVSIPSIGRSLFDSEGWRYLSSSRRMSQALLITESGALTFIEDESLRVPDALPFEIKQKGQLLKVHDLSYDKGLSVPGYPKTTKAHLLIFDKATPLDPKEPFEVVFKLGRRFATNQVLNKAITKEFALAYDYHGWRTKVYELIDTKWSTLDWVQVWQSRWIEITFLLLGLLLLTIGLIAQQTTSASSQRLRIMRTAFLLFTVGFIGWFAQGQLTIVNVTAAVESLTSGGDLTFLLNDPITSILWVFTAVTLLVWGRSTFCGWLCPFGALQELVSMIANAIGLHQRRLRTALDAKLKWIKYGVLTTIITSLFVAPSFAEMAVAIEPFETAISFYFMREWPYVMWAVICLGCGVLVYRGYCRYICPLGAALAAVNFLQRWSWIPRRDACGTPCQSCRHRCEYQAISPVGKINYSECFQCLDCVSIYQDQERCLPLIQERKLMRKNDKRFIPIYVSGDL
jgi:polyferredoxin